MAGEIDFCVELPKDDSPWTAVPTPEAYGVLPPKMAVREIPESNERLRLRRTTPSNVSSHGREVPKA